LTGEGEKGSEWGGREETPKKKKKGKTETHLKRNFAGGCRGKEVKGPGMEMKKTRGGEKEKRGEGGMAEKGKGGKVGIRKRELIKIQFLLITQEGQEKRKNEGGKKVGGENKERKTLECKVIGNSG